MVILIVKEIFSTFLQQLYQITIIIVLEYLRLLFCHISLRCPCALKVNDLVYCVLQAELFINELLELGQGFYFAGVKLNILFDV